MHWDEVAHPLPPLFILAFTEYPVENFHSIIGDQTSPHSTPQQITNTCCSIFASKLRQASKLETNFSSNEKLLTFQKSAQSSGSINKHFKNITIKPNNSYSTNPMDDEKRERMSLFLFENMCKSKMVLPCGFHLSPGPPKNWNQFHLEIAIFLLVENKMIQIVASLRVVGIPIKWHVFHTGHVQSNKKISDVMFAKMLEKQNIFSPSSKRHKIKSSDTSTKDDDNSS